MNPGNSLSFLQHRCAIHNDHSPLFPIRSVVSKIYYMGSSKKKNNHHDYLPLTIRIETVGGVATPLVLRGTPLPARRSNTFSTATDNQSAVEVNLLVGERPIKEGNRNIGTFTIDGIPPMPHGSPQINIEFLVNTDCSIIARAVIKDTDAAVEQQFLLPDNLSDKAINEELAAAEVASEADEEKLKKIEAINRAKNLVAQAEAKLSSATNDRLSKAVATLGLAMAKEDSAAIREASDSVEQQLTSPAYAGNDFFSAFFQSQPSRSNQPTRGRPISTKNEQWKTRSEISSTEPLHQLGKIFGGGAFTQDSQLCFVLMPFSKRLQPIYDDHIRPVVSKSGLRCERADDIHSTGLITWDIWERINRCRFVIADLTDINANVFYELGVAHAISKDAVLITQSMDFVPFDLKALRCIVYDHTPRGTKKLESALAATIDELMKAG